MKKILLILSALILSIALIACNNLTTSSTTTTNLTTIETTTTSLIKEITLSNTSLELPVSSETFIEYDLNFTLEASKSLTFSSSNEAVVTVNSLGKLKSHSYGTSVVTIAYENEVEVQLTVNVSKYYEIVLPNKTIYSLSESINTFGGEIKIFDEEDILVSSKPILGSMIIDQKKDLAGSQIIEVLDEGVIYSFEIYRLNEKQENILFDDFIYLNQELYVGERIDFALMKYDIENLYSSINNVYDYEEINIYAIFKGPDGISKKINAFWFQDYEERLTPISINTNLRLEGTVNDLEDDFDVFVNFNANGNPHYRLRYLPEVKGDYTVTLVVEVDDTIIQVLEKGITVNEQRDESFRGYVRVEEFAKRNFVFDNQETFLPVGQNVAWYTSVERKHYDYLTWFDKMGEAGMNYARVWLAAWGFSPFWNDIYNYDERQTNLFSLDQTLKKAEEEDIYIQLAILHHGMFSSLVNPMWPDASNTWYINRYGANPYGDIISNSGLFFTQAAMKQNFRNQLNYIVARYGYSDHIMSFELFNEVDWIENYNVTDGLVWHKEMADYLKAIDPNQHLVTTSLNNQSFLSNNYKVFQLNSVDFLNVHHYGIYNHTDYLPEKQYFVQSEFDKPVLYSEIGYSVNGGADQNSSDPNNVTLHQGLWAGAMGGGSGTGMHWWWESWTETYDVYDEYQGIATYAKQLDLSGANQVIIYSEDEVMDNVQISSTSLGLMGYGYSDRLYLYVFDKSYTLANQSPPLRQNIELLLQGLDLGVYSFRTYNTFTGEELSSQLINITASSTSLTLPNFTKDIAIILEIVE